MNFLYASTIISRFFPPLTVISKIAAVIIYGSMFEAGLLSSILPFCALLVLLGILIEAPLLPTP